MRGKKLTIVIVVFLVLLGILGAVYLAYSNLAPDDSSAAVLSTKVYLQTAFNNNKVYQREINNSTNAVTSWEEIVLPKGFVAASEISMAKGGSLTTNLGYTFLTQAIVAKQSSTNKYYVLRRTLSANAPVNSRTGSKTWYDWKQDTKVEVSKDSKVQLLARNLKDATPLLFSFVTNSTGSIVVQTSTDSINWTSATKIADNSSQEFSAFLGSDNTMTGSTAKVFPTEADAVFVTFVDNSQKLNTYFTKNNLTWSKFEDLDTSTAKNIKTVQLNNAYIQGEGSDQERTIPVGLMPVQIKKGLDNVIYFRTLNCFNPSLTCIFTSWQNNNDITEGSVNYMKVQGKPQEFVISYRGTDGLGYTKVYSIKIIPYSTVKLEELSSDKTSAINSNIYTDMMDGNSSGQQIIQTTTINNALVQRFIAFDVFGNFDFTSTWSSAGGLIDSLVTGISRDNNIL